MHAIYNTLQAPAIARESQSTACDIEMSRDKPCVGVKYTFQKNA